MCSTALYLCTVTGIRSDNGHWYGHVSKSVETNSEDKVTTLWKQQVPTDRTIPNNKPDIIICGSERGTRIVIDVAISGDRIVIKKKKPNTLKYIKILSPTNAPFY